MAIRMLESRLDSLAINDENEPPNNWNAYQKPTKVSQSPQAFVLHLDAINQSPTHLAQNHRFSHQVCMYLGSCLCLERGYVWPWPNEQFDDNNSNDNNSNDNDDDDDNSGGGDDDGTAPAPVVLVLGLSLGPL